MASGDSFISLAFNYLLGHTTVINSVHMVFAAIEKVKMKKFLPLPTRDMEGGGTMLLGKVELPKLPGST